MQIMYRFIVGLVAMVMIVSCKESNKHTFTVKGVLKNNVGAKKIYLEEVPAVGDGGGIQISDSAVLNKDGAFQLHGSPKESTIFNLRLDDNMYPLLSVINDVPELSVDIHLANQFVDSYEVTGSPASKQFKDFIFEFTGLTKKLFEKAREGDQLEKAGGSDSSLVAMEDSVKKLQSDVAQYARSSFEKASDAALLVYEIGYYQSAAGAQNYGLEPFDVDEMHAIIQRAIKKFPDHKMLAEIDKQLTENKQKMMAASWLGKEAPDFTLPDANGKEVKLSSFRGKYVLVDFWASWCGPCRQENPNVVKAYQQYKGKNFTILGVSLDKTKDKCQQAIKEDGLAWNHVSDLKFWDSAVVPLYGINAIPTNFLLDPQGKVIAANLRGPALEAKLREVLK